MFAGLLTSAQESITVNAIDFNTLTPVSNIKISLENINQGINTTAITNTLGKVKFASLPVINGYIASFEGNDKYAAAVSKPIDIRSNQDIVVQILLVSAKTNQQNLDEVIITSNNSTSKINRKSAEVSFELKEVELKALPVEGRDITRSLYRLPNVSQATSGFPEAPNVSINGGNSIFTSYLIDGLDNNERFLGGQRFAIPVGFTKDITVLTNNYSAEFGLSNNGVINVTTKSGGNELTGEVFFVTRPGAVIDASSAFSQRDLSGNFVKDGFQRYQQGFAIGGALVKNKTFFFLNAEYTKDIKDNLLNSPGLNVNEAVRGNNDFTYLSAKIDHNWSQKFRSSLRANVGLVGIERQGGGTEGGTNFPTSRNTQDRNSINIAFKNDYIADKFSLQSNFQYSRFNWNYGRPTNENNPRVVVLGSTENDTFLENNPTASGERVIAGLGHPGFVFDEIENTFQIQQKGKFYLDKHTIKAGLGLISGNHTLFGGGNPNGNYTVRLNNLQLLALRNANLGANLTANDLTNLPGDINVTNYVVELRPQSFGTAQNIFSAYIEDEYHLNDKLNIILGLRYDYDSLSKGGDSKGDLNNLAPRANFNYKLNQNSTLRGGYGIFYDKINYAVYSDALQRNSTSSDYKTQIQALIDRGHLPLDTNIDRVTFNGNIGAAVGGVSYLEGPTSESLQNVRDTQFSNELRILNPNGFQNPYTHQYTIGYQLQINDDKLFYVDLVHNRSEDLFRLRDVNAPDAFPVDSNFTNNDIRSVEDADLTRPVPIVNGAALINGQRYTGVARKVILTESEGKSRYWAASFNYQKDRGDDNYSYRINYTLSSLKNDTDGINFRAQDSNNFAADYGPSINDRTHIINGIFSYYPTKGLSLTLAGLVQSGQPITRIPDDAIFDTRDLNGDGTSFGENFLGNSDRSPGESRNNDRLPFSYNYDFSAQYQFDLGKSKIELRADVFNIFNTVNLSGFSNSATQSNQLQEGSRASGQFEATNAAPPRQFQFSARYLF